VVFLGGVYIPLLRSGDNFDTRDYKHFAPPEQRVTARKCP